MEGDRKRHGWTAVGPIRDRVAPGSNPGPPTKSCHKTSWKRVSRRRGKAYGHQGLTIAAWIQRQFAEQRSVLAHDSSGIAGDMKSD